ncbi:MAG: hypothetical protein PHC61_06710 [Chitinivibrionales bacterium]|nr:hypothetical protein [Chitinivibrionales bacterium]
MINPISLPNHSSYGEKSIGRKAADFASVLKKAMTGADQVALSDQAVQMQTEDRAQLLAKVKGRIKSGYYGTEIVIEDLSDSFAKVFNAAL